MSSGPSTLPRDAATVLVLRDLPAGGFEVYMLRRSSKSVFMPDVFVFPGGAVDPDDLRLAGEGAGIEEALVIAAIRESYEEAGILFADPSPPPQAVHDARHALLRREITFVQALERLAARPNPTALVQFSRWVTPVTESRRFDTRFYLARAPEGQIAQADAFETHDGVWITPQRALEAYASGDFAMIFPTIKHLERIVRYPSAEELFAFAKSKTITTIHPDIVEKVHRIPAHLEEAW